MVQLAVCELSFQPNPSSVLSPKTFDQKEENSFDGKRSKIQQKCKKLNKKELRNKIHAKNKIRKIRRRGTVQQILAKPTSNALNGKTSFDCKHCYNCKLRV